MSNLDSQMKILIQTFILIKWINNLNKHEHWFCKYNLLFKCIFLFQWDEVGSANTDGKKGSSQPAAHPLSQRKSMGSFKRYSLKLRRNTKEGIKEIISSDGDCTYNFVL